MSVVTIQMPVWYGQPRGHATVKDCYQQTIEDLLNQEWGHFADTLDLPTPRAMPAHMARKPKRHYRQGRPVKRTI